jgi:hypothetical protein
VTDPPNNDLGFRNMTVTDPDGNQLRFMEAGNAAEPSAAADGGRDFGSAENGSTGAVLTPAERSADSGRSAGAASCGGGGHRVTFGG